jgi:hypothetical protein
MARTKQKSKTQKKSEMAEDERIWQVRLKQLFAGTAEYPAFKIHPHTETSEAARQARMHRISVCIDAFLKECARDPRVICIIKALGQDTLLQFAEDMLSEEAARARDDIEKHAEAAQQITKSTATAKQLTGLHTTLLRERDELLKTARARALEMGHKFDTDEATMAFYSDATKQPWGPKLFDDLRDLDKACKEMASMGLHHTLTASALILRTAAKEAYGDKVYLEAVAAEFAADLKAITKLPPPPPRFYPICTVCPQSAKEIWVYASLHSQSLPVQQLHAVCGGVSCSWVLRAMGCRFLTPIVNHEDEKTKSHFRDKYNEPEAYEPGRGGLSPQARQRYQERVQAELKTRLGVYMPFESIKEGAALHIPPVPGKTTAEVDAVVFQIVTQVYQEVRKQTAFAAAISRD